MNPPAAACAIKVFLDHPTHGSPFVAFYSVQPITRYMAQPKTEKPTIEEVLRYAKPNVLKFISKIAYDLPHEQKDEVEQCAYLRIVEAYPGLDPDAGWRSFVYNHCRGAVLDYLKFGKGFAEDKWSIAREEEHEATHVHKIHQRVFTATSEGEDLDIDQILGSNGVFSEFNIESPRIQWDLIARMASNDEHIHAFAKFIRGQTVEEIGLVLGLSRARAGQLIEEFVQRFDCPENADSPWFCQTVYAFGLCKYFGIPDRDQSERFGLPLGQGLVPVNLDSESTHWKLEPNHNQMEMSFG